MSLKLPKPIHTVVDLGLQVYAMLWAITLVDGGMDLLKYSIIPCFFLWPAARLFNTYNSMLYRLNYLLQAGTDWWLDYLNELPPPFSGHLSILHSSALFWLGIGKAACHWWTAQLDIIFQSVTSNQLSDLSGVIFTLIAPLPPRIMLQSPLFSPAQLNFSLCNGQ